MRKLNAFFLASLLLAGCGKPGTNKQPEAMTQREKDSILANSKVPGAAAVKASMRAADSASAKTTVTDTAQ
jgi:uncharacterized protein YcfL